MSDLATTANQGWNSWDRFWFSPASVARSGQIRGLLCLITIAYFASCWSDAAFWYAGEGPFSPARVATFLRTSGLEDAAAWIVSPLFLAKSAWLYQLYLIVGMAVALLVALGRGGSLAPWVLWLMLIGWANRAMILSGLTETLLSLGLFASAIAPPAGLWQAASRSGAVSQHWRSGFSQRLLGMQVTVVLVATLVTMLGGRVWFNGLGAYALAAPAPDRTIDWTGTMLSSANVHESLTHLMVLALPVGLWLAWMERPHRIGRIILLLWCSAVALLGSHWLYGLALAAMILAIQPVQGPGSIAVVRD
jgi:hypothetical protein